MSEAAPRDGHEPGPREGRRPAWLTAPVLTVSALSVAAGVAQFSVTAVIGDVAAAFGEVGVGDDVAAQIGLPATTVGVALALVRVASLASLPIAALADRFGRRSLLLTLAAIGLFLTSAAALAPGFWWYVALVALARPALSTVNALAGVVAAEETTSRDRSAAIALITAAYGLGAGVVSITRGALPGEPSFRVVTAFAVVPLLLLPLLARKVREPRIAQSAAHAQGLPGSVPRQLVRPVALLALTTGGIAVATGPGFTYLFVYGEGVLNASPLFISMLVLGAGPAGLVGILLGRAGADRIGRRVTAALMMAATGLSIALAYAGGVPSLTVGYLLAIAFSSGFAPPTGALAAEIASTSFRATVAGWITMSGVLGAVLGLLSFGVLADLTGGFSNASIAIGIVVALVATAFLALPETLGHELDEDPVTADPADEPAND
ncbi:MFS transporter [Egicoccus sp. AB-alg6-2]|uniref:MFS transporter n=1 Tax=Egicoccus sp. AB-alg6-2 TaxID=3242692 RepID=UPI00359CE569